MAGVRVVPATDLADSDAIEALGELEPEDRAAPGSLLDRLRSRAVEIGRERRIDKPVPGWHGELVLRFRPLDVGQLERFVENRRSGRPSAISESIEALATSCIGVYGRDGERLVELADDHGPVRIEHRLALLLGMPIPTGATLTTREIVLGLFGGNAFALGTYVDSLVEWMSDPDANEAPGES